MLTFYSHIAGADLPGTGWVYTVTARSLLEDVFSSLTLKRSLEQDPDSDAAGHPYVVGRCAVAGPDHIDQSIDAAAAAAPLWATVPLSDRLQLGHALHTQLLRRRDKFLDLLVAEGHPRRLAAWEFSSLMQIFSGESIAWYRSQMYHETTHGPRKLVVRRCPDGVVCFNPPQNAPAPSAALAGLALMGGNAVVVRAPRSIPLSTMWLMREVFVPVLDELGAPPGVLNVICGPPKAILDRWIESPLVDDIFFIGDSAEGMRLQAKCVSQGKKPILELAGNDGLVVWRDAELDLAVEAITECFFGSGQICMVPKYVIAHPMIVDDLIDRLLSEIGRIRTGYPDDPDVLMSPVRRSEKFLAQLAQALAQGATLLAGGRRVEVDGTPSDTGVFLEPTLLRVDGMSAARDLSVVRDETFYPMLPIIVPEESPDELLLNRVVDFVNANEYGLRNSLWSSSVEVIDRFVRDVSNGGLLKVNDSHIGFLPVLPTHGGTGLTGGVFGEANYPILKTTHLQGISIATGVRPRDVVFDEVEPPKDFEEEQPCAH